LRPMESTQPNSSAAGVARFGRRSIAGFRFHHMLVRFSRDVVLLDRLAKVELDRSATEDAVGFMVRRLRLPMPILELSRRRRYADGTPTGTGLTVWSIADLIAIHGTEAVEAWQRAGALTEHLPNDRTIRLGDPTLLVSAAHEVAHVQVAEQAPGAPSHGKVFVAALDDSAAVAASWLGLRHPGLAAASPR